MHHKAGYTLLEMLVCVVIVVLLFVIIAPAAWRVYETSSLTISAENIRQLTIGGMQYLADNEHRFWKFRENGNTIIDEYGNGITGTRYWFGFESEASAGSGEGNRSFDPSQSPLAGYIPKGIHPDPSFALHASAFKPKFRCGYLGVGYNVLLGGGWSPSKKTPTKSYWQLSNPAQVVVFATSAQVNNFQAPASVSHPMIEEFYGIDQKEKTIHFRHGQMAMVGFADGSSGLVPMDESTRDQRAPKANVGRFAPIGSKKYLE